MAWLLSRFDFLHGEAMITFRMHAPEVECICRGLSLGSEPSIVKLHIPNNMLMTILLSWM